MNADCLLAVLPGSGDDSRVAVYLVRTTDGGSRISLRQQSFSPGLGWYDQKTLELEPSQLRQLRSVAGLGHGPASRPTVAEEPAILAFPGVRTESA